MTERYLFAALLLGLALHACRARAQDDETLLTARVCLSESPVPAECAQIVNATAERAVLHGRSYLAELRSYSPRATGVESYGARSWIAAMHPDRAVPASFAERMNRETLRVRFAALVVVAWRALHGQYEAPCPSATEWGAQRCGACTRRMRAAGCWRVECDGMANRWWGCS